MNHFLASNIRFLRNQRGWTQSDLAHRLNVKRSRIGAYEEGRAEPRLTDLQMISALFGIGLDPLIGQPLDQNAGGEALLEKASGRNLRLLSIFVDTEGEEKVAVVPVKAQAGYLNHYEDMDSQVQLPTFQLPLAEIYQKETHRVFQIEGDSMLPLPPNTYVLTRYTENWKDIQSGKTYVVVSRSEGVVYKRVTNEIEKSLDLLLRSDNPLYPDMRLSVEDITEVWEAIGFISFELPAPTQQASLDINTLARSVMNLQSEVNALKKSIKKPK